METIDRERMCTAVYPALRSAAEAGLSPARVANVVAATAEGYPFPTNLDRAQPIDGLAPPSQAELLAQAVVSDSALEELANTLAAQRETQLSH
jgi:hypothetical protein